ncbi:MAG: mechanosensitive ion channel family protein [Deltaproteobacteria bacterium]|nr:mechanosensitive ion channel family protein [Deltaproteobacteria bacterium]
MAKLIEHLSSHQLAGNALWRWLAMVVTVLILAAVAALIGRLARRRVPEPTTPTRYLAPVMATAALARTRGWLWLLIGIGPAQRWVHPEATTAEVIRFVWTVALGIQVGVWAVGALEAGLSRERARREAEGRLAEISSFALIRTVGQAVVWALILVVILANLGVEISTLVASLGVGGIAVALAAQNLLGDLFASLSIILDRPFEVGDFVVVGSLRGTVKRIGLKTTRVQSLDGEQIVFGNADLLTSRVQNFKHMQERRVTLRFGVLYSSTSEQVAKMPGRVKQIIEAQEGLRFDRAHFAGFGASSLDFEVIYWVLSSDYVRFMDLQQAVNLAVMTAVREEGMDFAFPSQSVYLESVPKGLLRAT